MSEVGLCWVGLEGNCFEGWTKAGDACECSTDRSCFGQPLWLFGWVFRALLPGSSGGGNSFFFCAQRWRGMVTEIGGASE